MMKFFQILKAKSDDAGAAGPDEDDDFDDGAHDTDGHEVDDETHDTEDSDDADEDADGASKEADPDEEDSDDDTGKPAPVEKSTSGGAKSFAAIKKQRNEFRERALRAEAIAEERARGVNSGANSAEQARIREEKLSLMDSSERKEFLRDEETAMMRQQVLFTQVRADDAMDLMRFEARKDRDPVVAKHAPEVERRLIAERNAGRNWPRATLLAQIVGERALASKPKKADKDAARERVSSVKRKPVSTRNDVDNRYRSGRGNESLEDMERRLENVTF